MPMLEVLLSQREPLSEEAKRAFREEAEAIFQDVLGTPGGRLRLFILEELGVQENENKQE